MEAYHDAAARAAHDPTGVHDACLDDPHITERGVALWCACGARNTVELSPLPTRR